MKPPPKKSGSPDGARPASPSTAPAEQTGLALPPADAVTALRIVGSNAPELALPAEQLVFNLGSGDHPDVHLRVSSKLARRDEDATEQVSRVHLVIERKGSRLWIFDRGSKNGTYIKDRHERDGYIAAGDKFRVGDVTLLALDDQMRLLRPTLRWTLGFAAHDYVDHMLEVVTAGDPLLLIGHPACEQRFLAEQIHATSARRGHGFVALAPPLPDRDHPGQLAAATKGSLFLDLAEFSKLPKWFVDALFGEAYLLRPIIAAPDAETATARLGEANMHRLRVVNIPPIRARRTDVPGILNTLFTQPPLSSHLEIAALGKETVERLQEFDWPGNFKDLRNAAPRVLAYIETSGNLRAAAEKVGRKHQSLHEALRRIGVIT